MSAAIIVVAVLVVVLAVWQTIQIQGIRRSFDGVPRDENTVVLLRNLSEQSTSNARQLRDALNRLEVLEAKAPLALSRVGVVAYNAFGNIAGNQSRSIALLSDVGDGLVVTLLASREETLFFTKEVRGGRGVEELSPEEASAVDRALRH